tara:strand:- start:674 stop:2191 length:1518 start_codon:yes stop_codon:yes gene_type:complete
MCAVAFDDAQTQSYIEPRIVGGSPAKAQDWKFYTQLVSRSGNRSYCGASYIGDGWVLTAAHCVDGDVPSQVAVKIGGYYYNGTDGVRANVSQIHIHPQYNSRNLSHDIALLKLSSIPSGVTTVEIAEGSLSQYVITGDLLTVAGLGRTTEGGSSPSVLQEVDVPLVSDSTCRQAGGTYATVGDVSFCAGVPQGGIDSCQGDSGGPIVINRSGTITQLGIVSWGIGCARPGKYGVYSDIAALRSFVDSVKGTGTPPSEVVSVGYEKSQTLPSFEVGQSQAHAFKIKNTGSANFTVDAMRLSGSGVIQSPMVTQDLCSQTTLSAGQQCSVSVEFGATGEGVAQATLSFGIDKTATTYRSVVSATAVMQTPPSGGCDNLWQASSVYNTGDTVSWDGQAWQAQWWTQGNNPSESGPWGVWQPTSASDCGSVPPTEPTPPIEPVPPTDPTPPTDANAYQAGTSYNAGDVVTNKGASYQCKSWPYNLWCGSTPSAYEPGVGTNWQIAWTQL